MTKGISKLQRTILGLLDGSVKRQVYAGHGALTTFELADELIALELLPEAGNRKNVLFTVRRACSSLLNRGFVEGYYVTHCTYPWAKVLEWNIRKG